MRKRAAAGPRRLWVLAALAPLAVVAFGAESSATFADNEISPAGEISIAAPDSNGRGVEGNPVVDMTFQNLSPGDQKIRSLTVKNYGTGAVRYSLTITTLDSDFHDRLAIDVVAGECETAVWPQSPSLTGLSVIMGDPAPGDQPGDRILAGGASEDLCLRYSFDEAAPNSFQGNNATHTLVAHSESPTG